MPALHFLSIFSLAILLSACGGENGGGDYTIIYDDASAPYLRHFAIIDSYGHNSDFDYNVPLAVSPYINFGAFDLLWDVISDYHYQVNFRINTVPSVYGSQIIAADYCGPESPCHFDQQLFCNYQWNFDVVCESPFNDVHLSNIDNLITAIPQTVYFILEVCGDYENYCEFLALPVTME